MTTHMTFQIGSFRFAIHNPCGVTIPDNLLLFRTEDGEAAYTYTLTVADDLPKPRGKLAARRDDILVFSENDLEMRYLGYHQSIPAEQLPVRDGILPSPGFAPYACVLEESSTSASVFIRPWILPDLVYETVFTSFLLLEKHLLREGGLILHCAYMVRNGKAICFTAPSGTGKSTQAGLWEKYRGTYQVNGDRALLQKIDGRWIARGWPVCGSSGICRSEDTPLECIVLLSQGKENIIEDMPPARRFAGIYPQITVNRWDRAFQLEAMRLTDDLLASVPVYHLTCTISEEAVDCLEDRIS